MIEVSMFIKVLIYILIGTIYLYYALYIQKLTPELREIRERLDESVNKLNSLNPSLIYFIYGLHIIIWPVTLIERLLELLNFKGKKKDPHA